MKWISSWGLSFLIFASALLVGCAKYRAHDFPERTLQSANMPQQVHVLAHKLNEDDARYYFGRRILSRGFQPILLTIKNPTSKTFMLDAWDIDLDVEHTRIVEKAINFSPTQRVIAWGVMGLFLWPFLIPAAVDGVMASQANKDLARDFYNRVISRDSYIKVRSYATTTKVMFVRKCNMQHSFDLVLNDRETGEKMAFNVEI